MMGPGMGAGAMDMQAQQSYMQQFVQSGFEKISGFQHLVEVFAHFAHLLQVNFDAVHGSFSAVVQFFEHFSHFGGHIKYFFSAFTFFNVAYVVFSRFYSLLDRFLGGSAAAGGGRVVSLDDDLASFARFQKRSPRSSWLRRWLVRILFAGSIATALYVLRRLYYRFVDYMDLPELPPAPSAPPQKLVRATQPHVPRDPHGLPFQVGDIIAICGMVGDGTFLEGELNGRRGLVPRTHVQVVEALKGEPHPPSGAGSAAPGSRVPDWGATASTDDPADGTAPDAAGSGASSTKSPRRAVPGLPPALNPYGTPFRGSVD
mmetsp:Transcript_2269/g.6301  ORF Transcript_2269/g.6301 Transcript_2269/m.6301 type:complete len:316 (+) Transcript_2269:2-949(+)